MRAALESVPGVRKTEVDFAKHEATVTADKKTLDPQALLQTLEKAGYHGSVKGEPSR